MTASKLYELCPAANPDTRIWDHLTTAEWFEVFLKGEWRGTKLRWIQPAPDHRGDESKRVTFEEGL